MPQDRIFFPTAFPSCQEHPLGHRAQPARYPRGSGSAGRRGSTLLQPPAENVLRNNINANGTCSAPSSALTIIQRKKKMLIQPTETRGKGPQSEGEKSNSKDGSATWEGITLRRGIRRPWETGLTGGLLEAPAEGPAQPRTSPLPQPPRPAPPRAAMSRRVHCFTLYSSQQKMGYSGLNQIFRHCLSMLLQV